METGAAPIPQARSSSSEQELAILTEIGRILSSTLELRDAFGKMMQIISEKLDMRRGSLVLLDESTGRLRTEAAVGLTPDEMERGKYALGEGITGNVVATGRARIIPDLRAEPDFLNRTGRLTPETAGIALSFLCVPIKIENRTAGALSVDKPFRSNEELKGD
jgi:Nif-specific regulatory protein